MRTPAGAQAGRERGMDPPRLSSPRPRRHGDGRRIHRTLPPAHPPHIPAPPPRTPPFAAAVGGACACRTGRVFPPPAQSSPRHRLSWGGGSAALRRLRLLFDHPSPCVRSVERCPSPFPTPVRTVVVASFRERDLRCHVHWPEGSFPTPLTSLAWEAEPPPHPARHSSPAYPASRFSPAVHPPVLTMPSLYSLRPTDFAARMLPPLPPRSARGGAEFRRDGSPLPSGSGGCGGSGGSGGISGSGQGGSGGGASPPLNSAASTPPRASVTPPSGNGSTPPSSPDLDVCHGVGGAGGRGRGRDSGSGSGGGPQSGRCQKQRHKEVEQQRRRRLRASVEALQAALPAAPPGARRNVEAIVSDAVAYVARMRRRIGHVTATNRALTERAAASEAEGARLRAALAVAGAYGPAAAATAPGLADTGAMSFVTALEPPSTTSGLLASLATVPTPTSTPVVPTPAAPTPAPTPAVAPLRDGSAPPAPAGAPPPPEILYSLYGGGGVPSGWPLPHHHHAAVGGTHVLPPLPPGMWSYQWVPDWRALPFAAAPTDVAASAATAAAADSGGGWPVPPLQPDAYWVSSNVDAPGHLVYPQPFLPLSTGVAGEPQDGSAPAAGPAVAGASLSMPPSDGRQQQQRLAAASSSEQLPHLTGTAR